jgi:hypothetical protein
MPLSVPGSVERVPHGNLTFKCPVLDLLRDKHLESIGPRLWKVIATEEIRIEISGHLEIVLTPGAKFYSISWERDRRFHDCRFVFEERT